MYLNETVAVTYISGKVVNISSWENNIFEIEGYTVGMSEEEVAKNFEKNHIKMALFIIRVIMTIGVSDVAKVCRLIKDL